MTLRRKLLLVALCTLVLPVAGWLYLRQMDGLLRQGQEQALLASAQAVARSVASTNMQLPAQEGWFVQTAADGIIVDGFGGDWAGMSRWRQAFDAHGALLLAEADGWLYFYAEVTDASRSRMSPGASMDSVDHMDFAFYAGGALCRYQFAAAAPGNLAAEPQAGAAPLCPNPLTAVWQENGSGYRVEGRLPLRLAPSHVGVAAMDSAAEVQAVWSMRPLLQFSPAWSHTLAEFAPDDTRVRLVSKDSWVLADTGMPSASAVAESPGWLSTALYRLLVAQPMDGSNALNWSAPRLDAVEVWQALSGVRAASWRGSSAQGRVVLAAVAPLSGLGGPTGAVVLEQASRGMPLLANRGMLWLLLTSFGAMLVAGAVLFFFAARLSMRIGKLADAAERAQARDGRALAGQGFPLTESSDELGELARSFARLLASVASHTDYLRTLASKLSHELNTPLAVVTSSLENLEQAQLSSAEETYVQRAREGANRLGALVRAMGASSRVERAIDAAEAEDFDLRTLVAGCADGYRLLAGSRDFNLELSAAALTLHGAPDLIAQALDKLFDNALSFTAEDGWIQLRLRSEDEAALVEMSNHGQLLPDGMQGHLFDSLVSVRDSTASGATPHLGLGLHIVRLIAERHGGDATARNLDDGSGVAFTLRLRGMPRQRLLEHPAE